MPPSHSAPAFVRRLAAESALHSHVPFSGHPEAVILILENGTWIPGVRVESAAFSLTIPPLLNAATTAVALGAVRVRAAVASRAFHAHEVIFARSSHVLGGLDQTAPDVLGDLPEDRPTEAAAPFLIVKDTADDATSVPGDAISAGSMDPTTALALARRVAARAHVPESDFQVAALVEIDGVGYIPGVNVEHDDWMQILCAERNALGTAVSYGYSSISSIFLTCQGAPRCTPCGACRQLMAELAPTSTLWMVGDHESPTSSDPAALLPGFFAGRHFLSNT